MEEVKRAAFQAALSTNPWNTFLLWLREHRNAHTVTEANTKNQRVGEAFEHLCVLYLRMRYPAAWRLPDLPVDIREQLGLAKMDRGVDIVLQLGSNGYVPVQCKYRADQKPLAWSSITTFTSLTDVKGTTGPWARRLVMTNVKNIKWHGNQPSDVSTIAEGTWAGLTKDDWLRLGGADPNTAPKLGQQIITIVPSSAITPGLILVNPVPTTVEELRAARLKALDKLK